VTREKCVMGSCMVFTLIKVKRIRWAGYVVHTGYKSNACGVLVAKPPGKRSLGRCGHSWDPNPLLHSPSNWELPYLCFTCKLFPDGNRFILW